SAYLLIFRNDSDQNSRTLFRRQAVRVLPHRSIRNCAKHFTHPIRAEPVTNLISIEHHSNHGICRARSVWSAVCNVKLPAFGQETGQALDSVVPLLCLPQKGGSRAKPRGT